MNTIHNNVNFKSPMTQGFDKEASCLFKRNQLHNDERHRIENHLRLKSGKASNFQRMKLYKEFKKC